MTTARHAAIVTGASHGIGAAIAGRLARDGFPVIVNYSRSKDEADAVAAAIEKAGGAAASVQGDVADPGTLTRLFDAAEALSGRAGVLVNNAGLGLFAPLADVTDEAFDRQMAVNVKGVFNGLREAARRLADGGRVINLSTSVIGVNMPTYGVYGATKAAVETMTRVAAKELGARRITVNAVAPGPIDTDLFRKGKDEATIQRITSMIPLSRLGTPEEIASAVSFLAGPDGGWINGQVLRANGGMV